jgi:hypothetical protein
VSRSDADRGTTVARHKLLMERICRRRAGKMVM